MTTYFFRLFSLIIFTQTLVISAFASEVLLCKSEMPIYGFQGAQAIPLNKSTDDFTVADDKFSFIRVGINAKRPLVDILPWGGITYKLKKSNSFKVEVKTDYSSYVSVLVTGVHTDIATKLDCVLKDTTFSRQPQSLKDKGTSSVKNRKPLHKGNPINAH